MNFRASRSSGRPRWATLKGEVELMSAEEAGRIAGTIGKPVAVKAQMLGRRQGEGGRHQFRRQPEGCGRRRSGPSGHGDQGPGRSRTVLVEEKLDIETEYYVGMIVDPSKDSRCPVVMFSTEGGMDIEAVPEDKIGR